MKIMRSILICFIPIAVAFMSAKTAPAVPLPANLDGYYKFGYFDDAEHAVKVEMENGRMRVHVLPDLETEYIGVIVGEEIYFEDASRWAVVTQLTETTSLLSIHYVKTGEVHEFSVVKITQEEANEISERDRLAQLQNACANNLKQLGLALHLFAAEHGNEFPLTLDELYPGYISDKMTFVCPLRGGEFRYFDQDYEYIPGFSLGSPNPDQEAIVTEVQGNHLSPVPSRHVLYLDGHVELIPDFQD